MSIILTELSLDAYNVQGFFVYRLKLLNHRMTSLTSRYLCNIKKMSGPVTSGFTNCYIKRRPKSVMDSQKIYTATECREDINIYYIQRRSLQWLNVFESYILAELREDFHSCIC